MSDWDCSSLLGYGNNLCYFNLLQYLTEIQKMKYLHSDITSSMPDESRSSADDLKKNIFASKIRSASASILAKLGENDKKWEMVSHRLTFIENTM